MKKAEPMYIASTNKASKIFSNVKSWTKSSGGGELPPLTGSAWGTSPFPPPSCTPMSTGILAIELLCRTLGHLRLFSSPL